jgi:histone H2B
VVDDQKKRKQMRSDIHAIYIRKVLKQVHPDTSISIKALSVMNSVVADLFESIASETAKLSSYNNTKSLTSLEIQTDISLTLPSDLAKRAVSEGTNAVMKFST